MMDNTSAHNSGTKADEWKANSWTTVLALYGRCQEPSHAAADANTDTMMTDTNKKQTDDWTNNPWSSAATSLSQPAPPLSPKILQ